MSQIGRQPLISTMAIFFNSFLARSVMLLKLNKLFDLTPTVTRDQFCRNNPKYHMLKSDSAIIEQKSATLAISIKSINLQQSDTVATIDMAEWRLCPTGRVKRTHIPRVDLRFTYGYTIVASLVKSNPQLRPIVINHDRTSTIVCESTNINSGYGVYTVIIRGTSAKMRIYVNSTSLKTPNIVLSAIRDGELAVHIACLSNHHEMRINMHTLFQAVVTRLLPQFQSADSMFIAITSTSLLEMVIDLRRPEEKFGTQLIVTCYSTRLVISSTHAIKEHPRETVRLISLLKAVYNWSQQFSEDGAVEVLSNQERWPTLLEMSS